MKYIFLCVLSLICCSAFAQPITSNFYKVDLVRVVDGDTFKVNLACNYKLFCRSVSVRVAGINCPELRSKDETERQNAKAAKEFTKQFLDKRKITLKNCQKGKYFRMACNVFADEEDLAAALLEAGHAVPVE